MQFIGIDGGKSGAVVTLDSKGRYHSSFVMPTLAGKVDPAELYYLMAKAFSGFSAMVYLERFIPMPKMGSTSAYTFGVSFGYLEMALAALCLPYVLVSPQKWQNEMLAGTDKQLTTKERAAIATQRLFGKEELDRFRLGKKNPHDGLVDARLLAEFCYRQHGDGHEGAA